MKPALRLSVYLKKSIILLVLFLAAGCNFTPLVKADPGWWIFLVLGRGGGGGADAGAGGSSTVATPGLLPAPGLYSSDESIVLFSSTPGASIYYTVDGSDPTEASPLYTSPIPLSSNLVLKAMARKSGLKDSAIATGSYRISLTDRTLSFDSPMDTSVAPLLVAEAYDGSAWKGIPTTGTTFVWSDSQSLSIHTSWGQYPENTQLRFTLSGLRDSGGNAVANRVESFTTSAAGVVYPVTDTGQTLCYSYYSGGALASCGDLAFPGQDGDYADTPVARGFTGPSQDATYAGNYTTTDSGTGLVWKSCTEGKSGATCATGTATTFTWYNAINGCASLNQANGGAGYAGRTDWRLPTSIELETLLDYSKSSSPVLDGSAFPGTLTTSSYWTSTTSFYGTTPADAWAMDFSAPGNVSAAGTKSFNYLVRCVAGGAPASRSYTDLKNGIVKDDGTGLLWQRCSFGQSYENGGCTGSAAGLSWGTALFYCNSLSLGGRVWRLPSINELSTLIDRSRSGPAIDTAAFPGLSFVPAYWSSTTVAQHTEQAWYVHFSIGGVNPGSIKTNAFNVRCVAPGP